MITWTQIYLAISFTLAFFLLSAIFFIMAHKSKIALLLDILRHHKDSLSDEEKNTIVLIEEKL